MIVKQVKWLFLILLLGGMASASLVIHITQGVSRPFTLAVVPFAPALVNEELPEGFSHVVAEDLTLSGEFKLAAQSTLPKNVHQVDDMVWSQWNAVAKQNDYALLGQIIPLANGNYKVRFELVSLVAKQMVLGKVYSQVTPVQLRALAHHISDLVYQFITGKPGVFSTRLAYVAVLGQVSRHPLYELVVADSDGFNPHILLKQYDLPLASPIWSPDGQNLAYVTYQHNRMIIMEINVYTGKRTLLADYPGINSAPAWSPDGTKLAMALSMGKGAQTNIYIRDLKTKQLKCVTHLGTNTSPRWSADGRSLIFTSNRSGNPQVYQLDLASGDVTLLTQNGVQNFSGVYTPDNQNIVYMHQGRSGGAIQIAKLNLNTNQLTVLTKGQLDKSPSLSPNGQMVIYANYDSPRGILAEVSINGNVALNLPATEGSVQSPTWSPYLH